jgi:hypothetical protein
MTFSSQKEIEGEFFSFSADCFRYDEKENLVDRFSIGIANMRL